MRPCFSISHISSINMQPQVFYFHKQYKTVLFTVLTLPVSKMSYSSNRAIPIASSSECHRMATVTSSLSEVHCPSGLVDILHHYPVQLRAKIVDCAARFLKNCDGICGISMQFYAMKLRELAKIA